MSKIFAKKKDKPIKVRHLKDKTTGLLNFSDYKRAGRKVAYSIFIILLVIFALIAITPIIWLAITAMKTEAEINSINYHLFPAVWDFSRIGTIWKESQLGRYYLNTLIVCAGSVVCAVFFNAIMAYSVAIIKPFGHKVIHALVMLGYMIPAILSIYPLSKQIVDFGGVNHYTFLWLAFGANAYYYMLFKDHFEKIPKSLIEAARMDGCGNFEIFLKVVLPLSKSIIGIVAIFAMTASYSDFLLPYLILDRGDLQTVMVGIFKLSTMPTMKTTDFLIILVLSMIPQIVVFIIFQKQIMGTGASTGMKD